MAPKETVLLTGTSIRKGGNAESVNKILYGVWIEKIFPKMVLTALVFSTLTSALCKHLVFVYWPFQQNSKKHGFALPDRLQL
jgi:hypothetical protein